MLLHRWFTHSRGLRAAAGALALSSLLGWTSSAGASLIVNDTWQDSDRTVQENGTDSDSDTDTESAWFINSPNLVISPGHMTSTQPASSQNWTTYFAADATPVTLAHAGDVLTVKLVFTPSGRQLRQRESDVPVRRSRYAERSAAGRGRRPGNRHVCRLCDVHELQLAARQWQSIPTTRAYEPGNSVQSTEF